MNRAALLAAAAAAFIGAALLWLYIERFENEATGGQKVMVLMAVRDIQLGEPLTKQNVVAEPVPAAYVKARHIRASDVERVIGIRVSMMLKANDAVLWTDLATTTEKSRVLAGLVSTDMRAVAIVASATSTFGGLLRPGNRVDALLTTAKPNEERVTIPLLQNLLVLATGSDVGKYDPKTSGRRGSSRTTVTVHATPEQAQLLTYAMDRGRISLILRNSADIAVVTGLPETTAKDVMELERRKRAQTRVKGPVEIGRGGGR